MDSARKRGAIAPWDRGRPDRACKWQDVAGNDAVETPEVPGLRSTWISLPDGLPAVTAPGSPEANSLPAEHDHDLSESNVVPAEHYTILPEPKFVLTEHYNVLTEWYKVLSE